jgi:oligosaccharide repeat unit polymerase
VFDVLLTFTGVVICMSMLIGYRSTGDPLMPTVVFGPMLFYVYAYSPAMLMYHGQLEEFLLTPEQLEYVGLINLSGVTLFCIGCLSSSRAVRYDIRGRTGGLLKQVELDDRTRGRLFNISRVLGIIGVAAFCYMVYASGGPAEVFSKPKPFLQAPSGFIKEMPMMAYPAIVLLAMTLRGQRIHARHLALALFFASPHLIMGSLGGRRGPAFLIMCTLAASWYIAKNRRPKLKSVLGMLITLGIVMLFLVSNRKNVFIGSEREIDTQAFTNRLTVAEASEDQEFVYSSGLILTADYKQQFYWGLRYFSLLFVRPIPRQIWPTKYEDLGLGWMVTDPATGGFDDRDWYEAVGFVPARGAAGGFVADLFIEFWWYGLIGCYLIGRLYGYCWAHSNHSGQFWTILYVELLALSVYLPAQSVGAWLFPAIILTGSTWLVWQRIVARPRKNLRASTSWGCVVR